MRIARREGSGRKEGGGKKGGGRRRKQEDERETIPFSPPTFRGQKSPGLRSDEWQVRPFLGSGVYPGPLIRYFIGHNPPPSRDVSLCPRGMKVVHDIDGYISLLFPPELERAPSRCRDGGRTTRWKSSARRLAESCESRVCVVRVIFRSPFGRSLSVFIRVDARWDLLDRKEALPGETSSGFIARTKYRGAGIIWHFNFSSDVTAPILRLPF